MLQLTNYENDLFELFIQFTKSSYLIQHLKNIIKKDGSNPDYNVEQLKNNPSITLRVAGGWVRDKMLGCNSNDIDFAIDNMKGLPFVQLFLQYLKINTITRFKSLTINPDVEVVPIDENLEANKLIAPATLPSKCLGLELDFVNLRDEEYTKDSRKPIIKFGTPQSDAFRRDLTINSMFYNIHTGQVENFVGSGFMDLKTGIIRTPLDPTETFTDDPLRILRTIRFAAKLKFTLVPELQNLINNPPQNIQTSLNIKVKRERFSKELEKMFTYDTDAVAIGVGIILNSGFLQDTLFNLKDIDQFDKLDKTDEHSKIKEFNKFFLGSQEEDHTKATRLFNRKIHGTIQGYEDIYIYFYNQIGYCIDNHIFQTDVYRHFDNIYNLVGSKQQSMIISFYISIFMGLYFRNNFTKHQQYYDNLAEYISYYNVLISKDIFYQSYFPIKLVYIFADYDPDDKLQTLYKLASTYDSLTRHYKIHDKDDFVMYMDTARYIMESIGLAPDHINKNLIQTFVKKWKFLMKEPKLIKKEYYVDIYEDKCQQIFKTKEYFKWITELRYYLFVNLFKYETHEFAELDVDKMVDQLIDRFILSKL